MPKTVRCQDCEKEFTDEEIRGMIKCPSCESIRPPVSIAHDILLPINWHELRCLTIWATNWMDSSDDYSTESTREWLQRLLNKIHKHRPEGGGALTIAQEIKELQKCIPSASLIDSDGTTIIPPKDSHELNSD